MLDTHNDGIHVIFIFRSNALLLEVSLDTLSFISMPVSVNLITTDLNLELDTDRLSLNTIQVSVKSVLKFKKLAQLSQDDSVSFQ